MRRRPARGVAALATLMALAASCKKAAPARDAAATPPPVDAAPWVTPSLVIDRVEVSLGTIPDAVVSSRELGRQLARCLIEAGDDVVALARQVPAGRRPVPAAIALGFDAATTPDGADRVVTLTASVTWQAPVALPAPRFELAAQGPILDGRTDVATVAVIERLREEACRGLAAQIELLAADDLAPGLAADDPTLVQWTLALIAARRPPGLGAAVAALLERPPPVGDAALAALVALGDPATVSALTAQVDLSDAARLGATLDAVIAIGGPDAEAFLQVLTAHRSPDVAARATAGLAELRQRRP
ncbi:MAG: hypothetical protein IPH44_16650 [Myxococcales bacterium]|nr:hypothetical protein [Myxococcales bacterium]